MKADDGSWASETLEPGDAFERTFDEPGAYAFFCSFHGSPSAGMAGTILVGDVPLPGASTDVGPGRESVPSNFGKVVKVPGQVATSRRPWSAPNPAGWSWWTGGSIGKP